MTNSHSVIVTVSAYRFI